MNVEENKTISNTIQLCSTNSCTEMIEAGPSLIYPFFGHNEVLPFVKNLTDYWSVIKQMPKMDRPDKGTMYLLQLRKLVAKTDGILEKLCVYCPSF